MLVTRQLFVCLSIGPLIFGGGCALRNARMLSPTPSPPGATLSDSGPPAVSLGEDAPARLDSHVDVAENAALGQRPNEQQRDDNSGAAAPSGR